MSRRGVCAVVATGVALAGTLAQERAAGTPWPRGAELDFGALATRAEAVDTLWLANPTAEPFRVEAVRASCGCTAVDWPAAAIAPGETAAIAVSLRCTRGAGPLRRRLDVWLSHLRRAERVYVYADCPPRG